MSAARHLHVVDVETGHVLDNCPECLQKDDAIAGLNRSLGKLDSQIRAMERDRAQERANHPQRAEIIGIVKRWKDATGHPNALTSDDRFDLVKARLREGYSVEQLELAVDGIGAFPYMVNGQRLRSGKPSQRHDRLGIALGAGEDVERFANLGHRARKEQR